MNRRKFIKTTLFTSSAITFSPYFALASKGQENMFDQSGKLIDFDKWQLTEKQWKEILSEQQFYILRQEGTERAYSNDMEANKQNGIYHCSACDLPVYSSEHKFESNTGWPSFWQPIDIKYIGTKLDFKAFWPRTEVHCARCKGHQGHVFKDGPQPTGLRYCINSVSLTFRPSTA